MEVSALTGILLIVMIIVHTINVVLSMKVKYLEEEVERLTLIQERLSRHLIT